MASFGACAIALIAGLLGVVAHEVGRAGALNRNAGSGTPVSALNEDNVLLQIVQQKQPDVAKELHQCCGELSSSGMATYVCQASCDAGGEDMGSEHSVLMQLDARFSSQGRSAAAAGDDDDIDEEEPSTDEAQVESVAVDGVATPTAENPILTAASTQSPSATTKSTSTSATEPFGPASTLTTTSRAPPIRAASSSANASRPNTCGTCEAFWSADCGGYKCGDRINYLKQQGSGDLEAKLKVCSVEFPQACGACCSFSSTCTSRGDDPYSSGSLKLCCGDNTMCLGQWMQGRNAFYLCYHTCAARQDDRGILRHIPGIPREVPDIIRSIGGILR